uniref:uncharacterized protein LOC105353119 n=1 Tax=Fragaria vesca subsp. vesca TaxID=101020 RepID=UPI0005C8C4DD|nr:PREDICTED: uncharacterized protein LOC105353119 [Fragaria vesca subsp. vesca]XP_011470136.1 PREDICTED: uncharacterized protein LOC105353119 [Fragaria vesca subsp. vesca]
MRALWEGCIASLTEWTSRAFLLQGGSGSGKTTCVENLLYRLRLISKDLKAQANCRIDIVELNMLKMQAPNDLVTGLIRYFGLADVADIAGIREFLAQLDNSMLILAIENIDISLQNQGWIDSLNQICHLATIGEIVLIGKLSSIFTFFFIMCYNLQLTTDDSLFLCVRRWQGTDWPSY